MTSGFTKKRKTPGERENRDDGGEGRKKKRKKGGEMIK